MEEPALEAADFDIDFGVTESEHETFDDASFSITSSERDTQRSAPRAIPRASAPQQVVPAAQQTALGSQPNSAGSSGSAFLNNILNPSASTFNNTQMSHTPPNDVSTSYEVSHFGKRQRSGVSLLGGVTINIIMQQDTFVANNFASLSF